MEEEKRKKEAPKKIKKEKKKPVLEAQEKPQKKKKPEPKKAKKPVEKIEKLEEKLFDEKQSIKIPTKIQQVNSQNPQTPAPVLVKPSPKKTVVKPPKNPIEITEKKESVLVEPEKKSNEDEKIEKLLGLKDDIDELLEIDMKKEEKKEEVNEAESTAVNCGEFFNF